MGKTGPICETFLGRALPVSLLLVSSNAPPTRRASASPTAGVEAVATLHGCGAAPPRDAERALPGARSAQGPTLRGAAKTTVLRDLSGHGAAAARPNLALAERKIAPAAHAGAHLAIGATGFLMAYFTRLTSIAHLHSPAAAGTCPGGGTGPQLTTMAAEEG